MQNVHKACPSEPVTIVNLPTALWAPSEMTAANIIPYRSISLQWADFGTLMMIDVPDRQYPFIPYHFPRSHSRPRLPSATSPFKVRFKGRWTSHLSCLHLCVWANHPSVQSTEHMTPCPVNISHILHLDIRFRRAHHSTLILTPFQLLHTPFPLKDLETTYIQHGST